MRAITGFSILLGLTLAGGPAAQAKDTFQCWIDDEGQRMCGDRVPPEYADKERQVINEQGVVVDTKKGAKTPEELAEEQRKAELAEEQRKQAEYDRYLLESYRSPGDIENMRAERMELIEGRLRAAEKALSDNEAALTDLRGRADATEKDGKKVNARLKQQIADYEKSLADNQRAIERLQKERDDVQTRFTRDLRRFRELRGIPEPPPEPEPAAAAAAGAETGKKKGEKAKAAN